MDELTGICRDKGLLLVEDAAHAIGGLDTDGCAAGTLGDAGCFSFYSNKNVATAEGGMVLCMSEDVADRVRSLRSHGMTTLAWDRFEDSSFSYDVTQHGYNYRIDDLRSAIGRVQLRRLDETRKIRERLVARYRERLASLGGWLVPFEKASGGPSFHLMVAVAPDEHARGRMVDVLGRAGVQTSLHYRCVPSFTAFSRFATDGLAVSKAFSERAVTLPLSPTMRLDEVDYVCNAMFSAEA
jgi:dTDP-4-amino-4,6-dideoxygalactose transaminase